MADLSSYIYIAANTVTAANVSATGNVVSNSAVSTTGNVTAGNIVSGGVANITGNITTANYFVGNLVGTTVSTTGNISAGNVIINGQPTTYGVVSPKYISVTNNTPQNIANVSAGGTTLTWDTTLSSNGITYSAGGFALTAGLTYQIQAEISLAGYTGYMIVQLVDTSNNSQIGSPQQATIVSTNAGFAEANNGTLDFIYTPSANQTVAFRVVSGSANITGEHRGTGFSRASIVQINPTIAVQATATGTLNSTIGNVTLSNSYSQVVGASIPGTTIFTLPTLQPGTYLITARAKVVGSYSAMGIFTGGSQVADTSAFSWYQVSGSVNNGLNGTWVLTVTTPTVYTINVWGGGTVSAGSDGSAVANYIQLNPTFALNALDTMSVTGNVTVGGNLSTTGTVTANTAIITTGNITTINSGLLQNGNSNITITSNGNVSIQAAGSNVELVVTSTGANVTGTLSATGNISGSNISATGNVTGTYLVSTNASGNEGGEITLAQPPNGNLSGGIAIDAYQNTLRMFEQGGTARGLSIDIANSPAGGGTAIGYRDIPQVAAGNVTLAATDAGKHYYSTTAGNLTLTIPLNSTVPFTTGTAISIVVQAAGNILVNAASGVTLYVAGNSTAANRVVGGYGMATLMKVASDTWFINGTGVS
jgi:hypothetical protein